MNKFGKVTIRYATKDDFESILKLSEKSWPYWWSKNHRLGAEHIKQRIKEKGAFVAVADGKIIGYQIFGVIWSLLHLEDVFVEKNYRRIGIASEFLEKIVMKGEKEGFRKIISDTDIDNKISYKFHLKHGFKKVGYIKDLWGTEDSFVFAKEL